MSKLLLRVIISALLAVNISPARSQSPSVAHQADLLFRDGKVVRKVAVTISEDRQTLTIAGQDKKTPFTLAIPVEQIKGADYTYTQKPQVWEAIGTTSYIVVLSGYVGAIDLAIFMPFILTKKKQHWLVIETQDQSLLLQLRNNDYRQLVLEMSNNGIRVQDSGKIKHRPIGSDKP
jgi:hypothetical protein